MKRLAALALGLPVLGALATTPAAAHQSTDWTVTTGSKSAQRYAPLSQIDRDNVARLEVAWRWSSPDNDLAGADPRFARPSMQAGTFQSTPLKVGDRLYVTTSYSQLVAIDATSGKTLWAYDPESWRAGRPTNVGFVHRGAAWWSAPDGSSARLLFGTGDSYLHAVDAYTGEPIGGFGDGGKVDLTQGLRRPVNRRHYQVSSPPMLCNGVAIVGASVSDGPSHPKGPPGDVRGFDPRTGELRWTFHSIPQEGEHGNETWENDSWRDHGNTNVWTLMSADEELGLVYLPFGTPTNDWYGGHRLGDNLFGESLVALDCATGERRWHFQVVHHGLWDYDLPTPPILGTVTVDGKVRQIAAQPTKQGFLFVFDRATGEPIWPVEERQVPQSGVPGERTSPTQPFPTRPPPFERQGTRLDELVDFTPELRAEARALVARLQYGEIYTPPSERGTLQMPGWAGGASFPGGAFDPATGHLFAPSFTYPILMTLQRPDATRSGFHYVGAIEQGLLTSRGLPLFQPPWSRVTAYDLGRGEIAWTVPLGDGPRAHPDLRALAPGPLGSGSRGHVLVTDTLLFVSNSRSLYAGEAGGFAGPLVQDVWEDTLATADGAGDAPPPSSEERRDWFAEPSRLRALDKSTGETLWQVDLPAPADGSPMTYLQDGKQYLVLAIGGAGSPAELIAFRLP